MKQSSQVSSWKPMGFIDSNVYIHGIIMPLDLHTSLPNVPWSCLINSQQFCGQVCVQPSVIIDHLHILWSSSEPVEPTGIYLKCSSNICLTSPMNQNRQGRITVLGVVCPFLYATFRLKRVNNEKMRKYTVTKDGRLRSVPAPTPTPDQHLDSNSNSSCQKIDDSGSDSDSNLPENEDSGVGIAHL